MALKKNVKAFGNPPVYHLRDQSNHFHNIMPKLLAGTLNLVDEFEHIRMDVQTREGNKRGMNLSRSVSEKYLEGMYDSYLFALSDHIFPMSRSYKNEKVYECI